MWKLKRLVVDGNIVGHETASALDEFERYVGERESLRDCGGEVVTRLHLSHFSFKEDIEEDSYMREKINIYKDSAKIAAMVRFLVGSVMKVKIVSQKG